MKLKDKTIFENIDKDLLAKFKMYHRENPEVWEEFKSMATQMLKVTDRYSHVTMIEVMRWNSDIKGGDPFKINNDFKALYARLMIYHYSAFKDFFELRRMKSEDRRDSSEEIYRSPEGNSL